MPMWPFGRRGGKATRIKDGGPAAVVERKRPVAGTAARAHEFASRDVLRSSPTRRASRRRRPRSPSGASMRDVEKTLPKMEPAPLEAAFAKEQGLPRPSAEDHITALPNQRRLDQSPHLRPVSQQTHPIPYSFHSASQFSLSTARERGRLQRQQSTADSSIGHRLSSKKQKREYDQLREEEIRAMSMPLPQKRPAGNSGGMLRRDNKKVKGSLNHRFERPTSNVSLPLEDSIHSSMSGNSDPRAFRVSTFDMFAPRPTVRYSSSVQPYYTAMDTSPSSKRSAQRGRVLPAGRDAKQDKRTSRIDDLADELDAGALREILDRDKRRREKKRKAEEERLRRRLERRAEKQKAADAAAAATLASPPASPHKQETEQALGLGIQRENDVPMEDARPSTPQQSRPAPLTSPFEENSQLPSPLPTPLDSPTDEPVISNAQAIRYSRGSVSGYTHTRGPSNVSQMPELLSERLALETPMESIEHAQDPTASGSLHVVDTTDTAATSKKTIDRRRSSEGRRMAIFASLFRRGKRKSQDQGRESPSQVSFSNTSRESMSRQPLPAYLVAAGPSAPIAIKRPSSVPRRTRSKFREDLPEFTPPDSRVQSPEVIHSSAIAARRRNPLPAALRMESESSGAAARTDSPVSPGVPTAGAMSQSLASVDSEGSWLSGKPIKRRSTKSHTRTSGSSSFPKKNEEFNASYEELDIPEDEYFRRLTPQPDDHRSSVHSGDMLSKRPSSNVMAYAESPAAAADMEDGTAVHADQTPEEDEQIVQNNVQRQPTVVHRQARVKSTEGLLSFFQDDKSSPDETAQTAESEGDSPVFDSETVTVQRARSVDLGKHHFRQLSAGSARLLDIGKRASSSSQSKLTKQ